MPESVTSEPEACVSERSPVDVSQHDDRQLGVPAGTKRLPERLRAAGLHPSSEPRAAWLRLREAEGPRATMVDLYALVARPRDLEPYELSLEERMELWRWAAPVIWPGFEVTEGTVRWGDSLAVHEYDPAWPGMYESWRARIASVLGETARRIEHVGSTSVPDLAAKPRIDIQVSVEDLEAEETYVAQLESLRLQLRSRDQLHRYFRPEPSLPRLTHVHVCSLGSEWEADHLLFRDYLRSHPEARDTYAAWKRAVSRTWHDDGIGYTDAKSEVILDIMESARRAATGQMH